MELTSSPTEQPSYQVHRDLLLNLAREALGFGIRHGRTPAITLDGFPPLLLEHRATFVTLEEDDCLRGCIGHLEATQPLILDVVENAVAAALDDPRFSPVTREELDRIVISISILTPPAQLTAKSEQDLLEKLQPGLDGLILQEGRRRATFLPSVWDELPGPADFVRHLKLKAGWPVTYWSDDIKVFTYRSEYLSEREPVTPQ